MKNSYPNGPTPHYNGPDILSLQQQNLFILKHIAEGYGVQIEVTIKPNGVKLCFIKKYDDKSVRKRQIELTDGEYNFINQKIMGVLQEFTMVTW